MEMIAIKGIKIMEIINGNYHGISYLFKIHRHMPVANCYILS